MIRAVVLDIGGVLEIVDDSIFPSEIPEVGLRYEAVVGRVTEAEVRAAWQRELGLDDAAADRLMADFWRWYAGTLDVPLRDWFAGLRCRGLRTGILSNSSPGGREAERHHGFEELVDVLVYSHEVGLAKPDPAVLALTQERLGVAADEIVLLDDWEVAVDGARAGGWHAVLHRDTPSSIAAIEELLAGS